jgi:hypothetical protein
MAHQLTLPGLADQPPPVQAVPEIALTIFGSHGLVGDVLREGGWFIARGPEGVLGPPHGTVASALNALIAIHNGRSIPYP